MRPEVKGALSLAEGHQNTASALRWKIRVSRRKERINHHLSKAQKLNAKAKRLKGSVPGEDR